MNASKRSAMTVRIYRAVLDASAGMDSFSTQQHWWIVTVWNMYTSISYKFYVSVLSVFSNVFTNIGFTIISHVCTDIDECSDGSNTCSHHAICTDTIGSYTCKCPDKGFKGDGHECTGSII